MGLTKARVIAVNVGLSVTLIFIVGKDYSINKKIHLSTAKIVHSLVMEISTWTMWTWVG